MKFHWMACLRCFCQIDKSSFSNHCYALLSMRIDLWLILWVWVWVCSIYLNVQILLFYYTQHTVPLPYTILRTLYTTTWNLNTLQIISANNRAKKYCFLLLFDVVSHSLLCKLTNVQEYIQYLHSTQENQ